MKLRDYQVRTFDSAIAAIGNRPLVVAPTGSGKTVIGCAMVKHLARRTVWLAHRRELVQQAAESIRRSGLTTSIIMGGRNGSPRCDVSVCSVQTIIKRDPIPADLVVVDEAHHVRASTYESILERYPGALFFGLTATPWRADGKGLGSIYGEIVSEVYADELVRAGHLVDPVVYAPPPPDLSKVTRGKDGEFNRASLAEAMSRSEIVGDIISTWERVARDRPTIVFACNVAHSKLIVEKFRAAGHKAEHIDGTTAKGKRDIILWRLRHGHTQIVSNCSVLTEGWDLPSLEVAIIARPTRSLGMHLQMLGRIMRAADGKAGAIVLDHAGNHTGGPGRPGLGWVTQRISYSLSDSVESRAGGSSTLRNCPQCFFVVPIQARSCPACGFEFPRQERAIDHDETVGLIEIAKPWNARATEPTFTDQREGWARIQARRESLGFELRWSRHEFKKEFGISATNIVDGEMVRNPTREQKRKYFLELEKTRRIRGYKPGWSAHAYRANFKVWPRSVR